jgi:hypothetical protein
VRHPLIVRQATNHVWINRGTQPCRTLFALIDSRQPTNNRFAPLAGRSCAANRVPTLLSRWSRVSDLVDVADVDADAARE